jgi:hypothetical protein
MFTLCLLLSACKKDETKTHPADSSSTSSPGTPTVGADSSATDVSAGNWHGIVYASEEVALTFVFGKGGKGKDTTEPKVKGEILHPKAPDGSGDKPAYVKIGRDTTRPTRVGEIQKVGNYNVAYWRLENVTGPHKAVPANYYVLVVSGSNALNH